MPMALTLFPIHSLNPPETGPMEVIVTIWQRVTPYQFPHLLPKKDFKSSKLGSVGTEVTKTEPMKLLVYVAHRCLAYTHALSHALVRKEKVGWLSSLLFLFFS